MSGYDIANRPQPIYKTRLGRMYQADSAVLLGQYPITRRKGKVQLVLTSPPFPLNRKKKYGNKSGEEYLQWFKGMARLLRDYLAPDGSIVIELGNAWNPGSPTMSTLPILSLLGFLEAGGFNLCQEFICYNPARLPSPAQWVTVERIRVKDAFTRVWWMSRSERPKAHNTKVLTRYSTSMENLLKKGTYNPGRRPSEHVIGEKSFLSDNGGAIPPNVLVPGGMIDQTPKENLFEVIPIANTRTNDAYQAFCRQYGITPHPARMQEKLAEFFVEFLTDPGDMVLDPFAGSNTTGAVAERLKRRWIASELDPIYAQASEVRVRPNAYRDSKPTWLDDSVDQSSSDASELRSES